MPEPLVTSVSPAFPLSWSSEVFEGTRTAIVAVAGELDRNTAPALRDHIEWLLAGDCRRLVLDTGAVTFADVGAFDVLRTLGARGEEDGCVVSSWPGWSSESERGSHQPHPPPRSPSTAPPTRLIRAARPARCAGRGWRGRGGRPVPGTRPWSPRPAVTGRS